MTKPVSISQLPDIVQKTWGSYSSFAFCMQEWFDVASDAEPRFVQVFALGWLVPYSHLEGADSPVLRNVGIRQLVDSDASMPVNEQMYTQFFIQWKSNCNGQHLKVAFFR